jgi:hypothetical protein
MSSKSRLKRVALVATAALSLGLLSAVPSFAVSNNAVLKYSSGDGTPVAPYNTGAGVAGPANTVTLSVTMPMDGFRRYVSVSGASSTISATTGSPTVPAGNATAIFTANTSGSVTVLTPNVGSITLADYVETSPGVFSITAEETVVITVNAIASSGVFSASKSKTFIGIYPGVEAVADVAINAYDVVSVTPVARVDITLVDGTGAPLANKTVSAVLAGIGLVSASSNGTGKAAVLSANTDVNGKLPVYVYSDGRPGNGSISVSYGTSTVSTKSVSFYGDVATIASVQKLSIANITSGALGTTTNVNPAVILTLKDSAGSAVSGVTPVAVSSDSSIIALGTCSASDANGISYCSVSSANTTSGKTATVSFQSTVGVNIIKSASLTFFVGGAVKTVAWSFDKDSYIPGDSIVVNITTKDASGNPSFDGTQAVFTSLTSSVGVQPDITNLGASLLMNAGKGSLKFYAPLTPGNLVLTGIVAVDSSTVTLTTKIVLSPAQQATADALATATAAATAAAKTAADAAVAASKASDAAKAAADAAKVAADLATVTSQKAADNSAAASKSVADLGISFTAMVVALQAQIKSLSKSSVLLVKKLDAYMHAKAKKIIKKKIVKK